MNESLPTLRRGSRGDAVKGLQNALSLRGYSPGPIDGVFGSGTEEAVKYFQGDSALAQDGIVGPRTWESLRVHMVQRGDTLSAIALEYLGDANRWPEMFDLNRGLISDPDRIAPGQVLALP
jgi:peptidoglycan hydrolase-like protein with peptidoglycan-binding domain